MPFDSARPIVPFVAVDAAPKKQPRKATSNDSPYDFEHFESFAGPNTSESEFVGTIYDLLKAGADVYAVVDRNGKYDRLKGIWINRDSATITRAELQERFGQQGEKP